MINNRQNGRRRGRGGQRPQGGGGGGGGQGGPRDSGNRIDSRARGNAAQLLEKYKNLAADSQRMGDRVQTEYYLQFADHYFRVLSDQRGRYEEQRRPQNDFDDGDDDFADEGEPIRAGEMNGAGNGGGGGQSRGEPRRDGYRDGNRAEPRRDDYQRDDERRAPEARGEPQRRVGEDPGQRAPEPTSRPSPERAPAAAANPADEAAPTPAAPRRGRPRKTPAPVSAEAADIAPQAMPEGLDVDRLPPALGAGGGEGGGEAPKPRRRSPTRRPGTASQAQPAS